jgi:uncharacterized membrane protein SpoIIM required for sporulation
VGAAAVVAIDTIREFPTPEHIAFRFRLAGPMARALAWLLDLLMRVGALFVLGLILAIAGLKAGFGVWLLAWFALDWMSGALCEWLWRGQTPGKRALSIRVVAVDGLPAGLAPCLLRNILRAADWFPAGFAVGLVSMWSSPSFQRLGDLAAGTLVVYDHDGSRPKSVQIEAAAKDLAGRLPPHAVALIDGAAGRAIAAYVSRRRRFGPARRAEIANRLAGPLGRRLALERRIDPDQLLCALYHLRFGGGDSGMAGRAAAMLAARRPAWTKLEQLADGASLARPAAAVDLARLYRATCADLALADAYHLPEADVGRLHGLVAAAHLRFYRMIQARWSDLQRLVFERVPARLYGDGCLRVAFVCFFGVFVAATMIGIASPRLVTAFIGEETLASMREMYADSPDHRDLDTAGAMSGFYIQHNVSIALSCFASGVFAGVGSLFYLVFNGLFLGLVFGFMATVDTATRDHFFEFVSAHGPFELTGICLSGAAGLRMGLGLVVTKGLPRLESLRRSAGEAMPIMGVAAAMVAMAAPIEAFVSPSGLPLAIKRLIGALCAATVLFYLVGLGRRGRQLEAEAAAPAAGHVEPVPDEGEAA